MPTPAQLAKEFAAEHGFTITPRGRRYSISFNVREIAEVGGYPAALNAMRNYIDARATDDAKTNESIAWIERVVPPAQWQAPTPAPLNVGMSFGPRDVENGQIMRGTLHNMATGQSRQFDDSALRPTPAQDMSGWATKTPREIAADMIDGAMAFGATPERAAAFCKRITPEDVHPLFDDNMRRAIVQNAALLDSLMEIPASAERIRERAKSIRAARHSPFVLELKYADGISDISCHKSRDEALKDLRRLMSDKRNRPSYVNITYRGA